MNKHTKRLLLIFCLPSAIMHSSDECKQGPQSAHSSPSSSSPASAIKQPAHPLAKIFPLELQPTRKIWKNSPKIFYDPNTQYVLTRNQHGWNVYNLDTGTIVIADLPGVPSMTEDFRTIMIPVENNAHHVTRLDFYDFQEKLVNPAAEPFFSQNGNDATISPNGKYVLIAQTLNNHTKDHLYNIESHQQMPRNPLLILPENINEEHAHCQARFSQDSKKLLVPKFRPFEYSFDIIDIDATIDNGIVDNNDLFVKTNIPSNYSWPEGFDNNFKYYIKQPDADGRVSLYSIESKICNQTKTPIAVFDHIDQYAMKTHFSPNSKLFLAGYIHDKLMQKDRSKLNKIAPNSQDYTNVFMLNGNSTPRKLYTLPGTSSKDLLSPNNILTYSEVNYSLIYYRYNIKTNRLSKMNINHNLLFGNLKFSSDDNFILFTKNNDGIIYDLENNLSLFKVEGNLPLALNSEKRRLITSNFIHIIIYDIPFLHDPEFQKIVQGKLTLAQLTFIALLDKYYGNPISLAHIVQAENMPKHAVNTILRSTLESFPEIIKQAIIKTYNITDAQLSQQEKDELQQA